jgi:hypothetical protein
MAAIIKLEDGRALMRSNVPVSGMLLLISQQANFECQKLKHWLADVADRSSPFLDFDVRGFSEENRVEFWRAAEQALEALKQEHGAQFLELGDTYAAECLNSLIEMHQRQLHGEPPLSQSDFDKVFPFDGYANDLDELWFRDADA